MQRLLSTPARPWGLRVIDGDGECVRPSATTVPASAVVIVSRSRGDVCAITRWFVGLRVLASVRRRSPSAGSFACKTPKASGTHHVPLEHRSCTTGTPTMYHWDADRVPLGHPPCTTG